MSLANLIKKGSLRGAATATPATLATVSPNISPNVATVATVAVAKAPDKATNDLISALVTHAPVVREKLVRGPVRAKSGEFEDVDRWCWPHSTAMNTVEIDTFIARMARFTGRGVIKSDVEFLADRLVIRDREQDDRAMCLECTHLQRGGRCGNWQRAGVAIRSRDAQLAPEFMHLLQRCDGFTAAN